MKKSLRAADSQAPTKWVLGSFAVSAVFAGCFSLPAQAVPSSSASFTRYNINYNTIQGTGTLTGFIDVNTSDPGATSPSVGGPFPAWIGDLALKLTKGSTVTNYTKTNFDAFWWIPNSATVNWNSNLVGQFLDINFGQVDPDAPTVTLTALNTLLMSTVPGDLDKYELISAIQAVPGPLPLLGIGSAFALSRKLRRRQLLATKAQAN